MRLFIFDVPILVILGFVFALIQKRIADEHPDFIFHAGFFTVAFFWIAALFSAFGMDPWFGIIGGKLAKPINGWFAFFLVMSYPMWFIWGEHRAFELFGRTPRQGGFLWLFSIEDKTEPFKPAWNVDKELLKD